MAPWIAVTAAILVIVALSAGAFGCFNRQLPSPTNRTSFRHQRLPRTPMAQRLGRIILNTPVVEPPCWRWDSRARAQEDQALPPMPAAADCAYARNYCEENVYQLCKRPEFHNAYVVFISNREKQVLLWKQKAGNDIDNPVGWDYHVLCVCEREGGVFRVFDLDSRLEFGADFRTYTAATFRQEEDQPKQKAPFFRVVGAERYLAAFASDRSHMREGDGKWLSAPPPWPKIQPQGCSDRGDTANNLPAFRDMGSQPNLGRQRRQSSMSEAELRAWRTKILEEARNDYGVVLSLQEFKKLFDG